MVQCVNPSARGSTSIASIAEKTAFPAPRAAPRATATREPPVASPSRSAGERVHRRDHRDRPVDPRAGGWTAARGRRGAADEQDAMAWVPA